jgi:hypothetical protein
MTEPALSVITWSLVSYWAGCAAVGPLFGYAVGPDLGYFLRRVFRRSDRPLRDEW